MESLFLRFRTVTKRRYAASYFDLIGKQIVAVNVCDLLGS